MAIQQEIWLRDIEGNIFPENEFYMRSIDDTPFVMGGKIVHLPHAGAKPNVEKNRTQLPAPVAKRTDTENTYELDEFTTDPVLIQDTEAIEVSYPKRKSVLFEHQATLEERIADNFAYLWSATLGTNIVRTSGAARGATMPGATGTRKAVTKDDFIEVLRLYTRMGAGRGGICLIHPDMYADILKIEGFVDASKIGSANLITGQVGRLLDFEIIQRAKTPIYDNSGTPVRKAVGAVGAAGDNLSALFYSPTAVRRAKGEVKIFMNEKDATFYGDVFSALVRAGGRKKRADEVGVIQLVEAHGA